MIAFDAVTEALRAELKANMIANDGVLPQRLAKAAVQVIALHEAGRDFSVKFDQAVFGLGPDGKFWEHK